MDDYTSNKLKALSLGAMILVVFIHAQNEEVKFASIELRASQGNWVLFIENFVSKGIARIAVPLFFAISGYLFYTSYDFTLNGVLAKLIRRFKSLVVPYLFWSSFGLILFLCLQSVPWSRPFFTQEPIAQYSLLKLISTLLFNPIPYQLWFVRDLIMLVICSPLIGWLTKYFRVAWIVTLVFFWFIEPKTFMLFSNEALLFFSLGCALAIDGTVLSQYEFSRELSTWLFIFWIGIVCLTTYLLTFSGEVDSLFAINNLGILIGILAIWSVYDHADQGLITRYSTSFGYTFIIFVFHEPLLTILKKALFYWLGKTNSTSLIIYIMAPLIAISLSIFLRYLMKKHVPRLYDFATGGR